MTVLPSPEAMIVICTVVLIAYTAHVLDKAFASSEQFEAMLKARERIMGLEAENAKLRELVRDMWSDGMCECGSRGKCASCEYDYPTRMRELGVEVNG